MLSKLSNGIAGTWSSLDPMERLILIYGLFVVGLALTSAMRAPARREKKRTEMLALADLIAERLEK